MAATTTLRTLPLVASVRALQNEVAHEARTRLLLASTLDGASSGVADTSSPYLVAHPLPRNVVLIRLRALLCALRDEILDDSIASPALRLTSASKTLFSDGLIRLSSARQAYTVPLSSPRSILVWLRILTDLCALLSTTSDTVTVREIYYAAPTLFQRQSKVVSVLQYLTVHLCVPR